MPGVLSFNTLTRDKVPEEIHPSLTKLVQPHIDSFDFFVNHALPKCIPDLERREIQDGSGRTLSLWIADVQIGRPMVPDREQFSIDRYVYPAECRERGVTYKGKIQVRFMYQLDGEEVHEETRVIGHMPIMVKSDRCNLRNKTPQQLIRLHEEPEELGGYFIINGNEKIIRLLILPRRNYITGIQRSAFKNRGALYSQWGCSIRCVREDQSAITNVVHYLTDGTCTFKFSHRKQEFLVPCIIILKALVECTDKEIYDHINPGDKSSFVGDRVEAMLRDGVDRGLITTKQCRAYLGKLFRVVLGLPERVTDEEVADWLLRKYVFVHLETNRDKFNLLVCMIQKVYKLVSGECKPDNPDAPSMQETLLPGHLLAMVLKEKLNDWTMGIKTTVESLVRRGGDYNFSDPSFLSKAIAKNPVDVGRKIEYLMATGNLQSNTGLDLQQASGFTIVADKLNWFRYLSHFRCIHRGAFFSEMKTTAVRKLLPEAWGFLCPVHTPDGAPCGLLNHLSHTCEIVNVLHDTSAVPPLLVQLGMSPIEWAGTYPPDWLPVILDGRVIGYVDPEKAHEIAKRLRHLKARRLEEVPPSLEIAVLDGVNSNLAPAMYMFSTPARMVRPVQYLPTGDTEMIGSFEQVFMNISVTREETYPSTTHMELHPTNMLSVIANLTPFSDHNQSPRNMYQCQMGKQTMGTPLNSYPYRTDNKLYRIRTPQAPIVRTALYNHYKMDNYPLGTNAVVAVISYTGYDMEDAMIINKGSEDRGFAHGSVYKSKQIDISNRRRIGESVTHRFGITEREARRMGGKLDSDGFPPIGTKLTAGDPIYATIDVSTGECHIERYKDNEDCFVEEVRMLGGDAGDTEAQRAQMKLRVIRNPIIGDKFSSRHGQKGVCSKKWGMEDMPFTESGMQPDIIINPHAFPSRMTIGMLIESMAGKSGSLHGLCYDATPFSFNEKETAYSYFGEQLRASGYNYYGSERMYSGITGTELEVDIFIGVVYYQRLRHMVSDKFQVRTTGPVDPKTRQPVKGRKRHGGIRLGEMERDSLLAHGVSFLLQDRLFNCSDASYCCVCRKCGSILSPTLEPPSAISKKRLWTCRFCETRKHVEIIAVPYVFRYLVAEMYAMNMRLTLDVN